MSGILATGAGRLIAPSLSILSFALFANVARADDAPPLPAPSGASASPPSADASEPAVFATPYSAPAVVGSSSAVPVCPCGPGSYLHDGFYLRTGSGVGGGYFHSNANGETGSVSGVASSGFLFVGGTTLPGLVVGGGIHTATVSGRKIPQAPTDATRGWMVSAYTLGPFVDYYPDPKRGWHVGALAGLGGTGWTHSGTETSWGSISFGGTAFGGYDAWIGPEFSLGIGGSLTSALSAPLKNGDGDDINRRTFPLTATIDFSLVYH